MRRINDFSVAMTEVGMWAKVVIERDGERIEGVLGKCSEERLCFASNSGFFNGSYEFGVHSSDWQFVLDEYRYGWVIINRNCGDLSIPSIMSNRGMDTELEFTFVGIINESNQLISSTGSVVGTSTPTPSVDAMAFFNDKYERRFTYKGVHGYHHHHGDTPNAPKKSVRGHKIGVELEVEFKSRDGKSRWNDKAKSNWFYCERDGSLNDNGVEIITVPMNPKDIKARATWEPLIEYLSDKAKSWDSPRCGLHVHIGREILGSNPEQQSETIGKLLYLYHHFVNGTPMNTRIFGRDRAYNEKDGKTREGDAVATLGSGVLKLNEVKNTLKKGLIDKSSSDRYFDINLQNSNTIEFRKGRGSIKASRIIMVIEYCEMMCKYAKSAKWEEISKDAFVSYVVSNISKESPLYRFFEAGERCDSSF
jgi:hypothetical protein